MADRPVPPAVDVPREQADRRTRSAQHLNRWYHLVGYCLRPGFGDSLDRYRIEQLWKLLAAPSAAGGVSQQQAEGGADYWIMWRRVAGGLSTAMQNTLMNRLRPFLLPVKGKAVVKPGANELAEMWRAAASLERLDVKIKEALGVSAAAAGRRSRRCRRTRFWALTRLGARMLFYGPLNLVVHPQVVEGWLGPTARLPAGQREREERLGVLPGQPGPADRAAGPRHRRRDARERVLAVLAFAQGPGPVAGNGRAGRRNGGRRPRATVRRVAADRPSLVG